MTVRALTSTTVDRPVGGIWDLLVDVRDGNGALVDATPVVTVTLPNGSTTTPTAEAVGTGVYLAKVTAVAPGRHVARVVVADHGAVDFAAQVTGPTAGTGMPDVDAVDGYLGEHSWSADELQDALSAEAAAQRSVCRVGAVYPDDLRQALLRRVQRTLAMRGLPLAVLQGDAEAGQSNILPGRDPEVRRLEAPHRKLVMG